jgi:hypothetical protein
MAVVSIGNSEYGHFMLNPVRITERGPKTLGEITEIHQEMCAFAKEYEPEYENYHMERSHPQVLLVCDKVPSFDQAERDDGNVSSKKASEQQTVLVVKARPSEDIFFDDLASHALPLKRSDVGDLDVLRVPLSVAVEYMIALGTHMGNHRAKIQTGSIPNSARLKHPLGLIRSLRVIPRYGLLR